MLHVSLAVVGCHAGRYTSSRIDTTAPGAAGFPGEGALVGLLDGAAESEGPFGLSEAGAVAAIAAVAAVAAVAAAAVATAPARRCCLSLAAAAAAACCFTSSPARFRATSTIVERRSASDLNIQWRGQNPCEKVVQIIARSEKTNIHF